MNMDKMNMDSIYRYKFTDDFINILCNFAKIHQYDERNTFKEAWAFWIEENKEVAKQGGNVAKVARLELEDKTGKKVVTSLNAKDTLKALPEEKNKPKKYKGE